jgi:hypothetical protein
LIARLGGSGFGAGDVACPGDPESGHASPATTVIACGPIGGTAGVGVGAGVGVEDDVADGTGVTAGEALSGFAGATDAGPVEPGKLAGPGEAAALLSGALLSGALAGPDADTGGRPDPVWLRWPEHPAVVTANTRVTTATNVGDGGRVAL